LSHEEVMADLRGAPTNARNHELLISLRKQAEEQESHEEHEERLASCE